MFWTVVLKHLFHRLFSSFADSKCIPLCIILMKEIMRLHLMKYVFQCFIVFFKGQLQRTYKLIWMMFVGSVEIMLYNVLKEQFLSCLEPVCLCWWCFGRYFPIILQSVMVGQQILCTSVGPAWKHYLLVIGCLFVHSDWMMCLLPILL